MIRGFLLEAFELCRVIQKHALTLFHPQELHFLS